MHTGSRRIGKTGGEQRVGWSRTMDRRAAAMRKRNIGFIRRRMALFAAWKTRRQIA